MRTFLMLYVLLVTTAVFVSSAFVENPIFGTYNRFIGIETAPVRNLLDGVK